VPRIACGQNGLILRSSTIRLAPQVILLGDAAFDRNTQCQQKSLGANGQLVAPLVRDEGAQVQILPLQPALRAFSALVESGWIPKELLMSESTALIRFLGEHNAEAVFAGICVNG